MGGDLRQELDATVAGEGDGDHAAEKEAAVAAHAASYRSSLGASGIVPKRAPQRLRERLPEGLARPSSGYRPKDTPAPIRRSSASAAAAAARRNAVATRSACQRGRPPMQAARAR